MKYILIHCSEGYYHICEEDQTLLEFVRELYGDGDKNDQQLMDWLWEYYSVLIVDGDIEILNSK